MKKNYRSVFAAFLAVCTCAALVGCGGGEPSEQDIENRLEQLDGMSAEDAEREIEKSLAELDGAGGTASEDADSVETIDPFDGLTVTFSGTAPRSKVTVSGGNSLCSYTADAESGVFNGDIVTISAEFKSPQESRVLSEEKREYTVEGLAAYAMSLEDIPESTLEKLRSQAEDLITANVCGNNMTKVDPVGQEDYSFEQESSEFVGYYFLAGKENTNADPYNKICCVYKLKYSVTAYEYDNALEGKKRNTEEHITGYQEFYTLCELDDVILLSDGTCSIDPSSMKITDNKAALDDEFANYYGYKLNGFGYGWRGYPDLDSMFSRCIAERVDKYNYESTVEA